MYICRVLCISNDNLINLTHYESNILLHKLYGADSYGAGSHDAVAHH